VALGSERERERERERQMAAVDEERPLIEDDGALVVQVLSLSLSLSLSLICLCLSDLYFSFLSQWRVVPFLRLGCFSSSSLFFFGIRSFSVENKSKRSRSFIHRSIFIISHQVKLQKYLYA
jgi:hypothetical protein